MHKQPDSEVSKTVSLNSAFVALTGAALLYAVSWIMGCTSSPSHNPSEGKKLTASRELVKLSPEDADDKLVPTLSGRKLTVEKMAQRAATSLQYSNEEYGVAFDAPKGYLLKEGELPEMDRGLGYLGPVPMHFAESGGVRLATVEPPQGLHLGTNFVNEFFTVSAHYGSSDTLCAQFNISEDSLGAPVTRTIDGIEFHGFQEHSAASMHQYSGIYLHAFTNDTCYEIGYGVATAGSGSPNSSSNLKNINAENILHKLEKFLDNVRINPPAFERSNSTD